MPALELINNTTVMADVKTSRLQADLQSKSVDINTNNYDHPKLSLHKITFYIWSVSSSFYFFLKTLSLPSVG